MLHRVAANVDISPLPQPDADSGQLEVILGVVFAVMGAISVLIIVIAGFQFIMSRGDPQKTAQARNAIIYAALGLAVIIMAFAIVTFALNVF